MPRPLELTEAPKTNAASVAAGAPFAGAAPEPIHVMVGLIGDGRGAWLIAQRPPGKDLAGSWEFPGGKVAAGEKPRAALARELAEELGIEVLTAEPVLKLVHDYPHKRVLLDVWRVHRYSGTPYAREGQPLRWVQAAALEAAGLLPADKPIAEALLKLEAGG